MKKIILIMLLITCAFCFTSCLANNMVNSRLSLLSNDTKVKREFVEDFFKPLKNDSIDDLLIMFSTNALREDEEIKKNIDYILDTLDDNFTYEQLGSHYSKKEDSKRYSTHFIIKSNDKEYWMSVTTYFENKNKNEVGINQILFCSKENRSEFEKRIDNEYSSQAYGVFVE